MKIYQKIITTLLLVSVTCVVYRIVKPKKNINSEDTLVIGTASGYAPFASINANSEFEGFDIDVAKELAKTLNKKLEIKDLGSMTALFMALEQGKIDAIIWGLSVTQERLKKVAMVLYQGDVTKAYSLLFWKEIPNNIKSINDMVGKTVSVEPTSAQDAVLSKYKFINKLPMEKVDDALLSLQYGKIDAAFVEPAIAKKFKNKYPEIQILDVPLATEDLVFGIGIAIKLNNKKLVADISDAIKQLKSAGTIKTLEAKWDIT